MKTLSLGIVCAVICIVSSARLIQPPRRLYSTQHQVVRKQNHAPSPIHLPQSKPVPAVTQHLPVPTTPVRGRPHSQSIGRSSETTRTGNIPPVSNRGTPSPTSAVIPQRPASVPPITTAARYQPHRPVSQPVATSRYVHQPRRPVSQPIATPFSLQELRALDRILDSYLKTPSPYVTPPTRAPYTNYNNYEYTNSDCDCQKDSDSCPRDQYYNGDCEDGVECCGRW